MNSQSQRNKKGVSEIISYTILIIIALGAAALVYGVFKLYVPKDKPQCSEDITLIIEDVKCLANKQLNITFVNKGNFNITAAYIRIGRPTEKTRFWINRDIWTDDSHRNSSFFFAAPISPNQRIVYSYNDSYIDVSKFAIANIDYVLEVQPAVMDYKVNKIATCEKVTQTITCI